MTRTHNILFLRGLGLFLVALLSLQCSPDSDDSKRQGSSCSVEDLTAGRFSFTLDEINDSCADGLLDSFIHAGRYDSVQLPDFADLPDQTDMEFPVLGTQLVLLSVHGDTIEISLAGDNQAVLNLEGCELRFRVDGSLCPATADEIDVEIDFTFLSATDPTGGDSCATFQFESGCTLTGASKCRRCS